ncbi:uncharacterized protein LOC131597572 [Vicia villosa]|uniref:uncharacterized protein LOC131597572 n=1 Tax=Vicia villosa TaxID=3911 RepID=UPI00273B840F|nr:uncharacterized protein LOC131597572 [Vicia villosa]
MDGVCKDNNKVGYGGGLNYALRLGLDGVELNDDYMAVVNAIKNGASTSIVGQSLVNNIRLLLNLHWEVIMAHSYREVNYCGAALAKFGSKLIGVNITPHFMGVATNFLSFRPEEREFKFLDILIGSNPRRISSWNPLLDNVRRKLSSWKGRWLSFGGRVTLIKSILSSLAIFTLSFYKAPKKVIAELNRMQSNFLWGGVEEKRKLHWVKWNSL